MKIVIYSRCTKQHNLHCHIGNEKIYWMHSYLPFERVGVPT